MSTYAQHGNYPLDYLRDKGQAATGDRLLRLSEPVVIPVCAPVPRPSLAAPAAAAVDVPAMAAAVERWKVESGSGKDRTVAMLSTLSVLASAGMVVAPDFAVAALRGMTPAELAAAVRAARRKCKCPDSKSAELTALYSSVDSALNGLVAALML